MSTLNSVSAPLLVDDVTSSSSIRDVYARPPQQSIWSLSKALMHKNLILLWRRKRIWGLLIRVAFSLALPAFLWFYSPHIVGVDAILAKEICPLMGVVLLVALFHQFFVELVTDKEVKMRYVQEVAGVSFTAYWMSYYVYFLLLTGLATGVYLVFEFVIAPIYINSNPILMVLSLTLSFLQEFFLCMMTSTVTSSVRMAGVLSMVLIGASFGAPMLLQSAFHGRYAPHNFWEYFLQSLIPFQTPRNLLTAIGALETASCSKACGFTFDTFQTDIPWQDLKKLGAYPEISAAAQFWILIGNCLVYGLLSIWFDQVYQGQFGAAKPFYFCLSPKWMCPKRNNNINTDAPALKMEHLVKTFKRQRAVDGMSLEVWRGEIFALLGHNGAGKTTAINCITGMLPMSSGSIQVCGADVATQLTEARRYMSICPQDNPLYLEFSAREHLAFFAALRGVAGEEAEERISEALTAVGLQEKRHATVKSLSGGQKRRLWVATSLLGSTPMVFLDEPTSGMDPASRRDLWDLLVDMKNHGRCIVFTTHYLDEADVLAQRKAIIDKGKVRACGTSFKLKQQFGRGYHLRVMCKPSAPESTAVMLKTSIVTHVPSASLEVAPEEERSHARDAPKQWCFTLPYNDLDKFGSMLRDLENLAHRLEVVDVALETTSLEEVFMALGQDSANQSDTHKDLRDDLPGAQVVGLGLINPSARQPVSWFRAAMAVCRLRWTQVWQKKRSLWLTLILPGAVLGAVLINFGSSITGSMKTNCDHYPMYCRYEVVGIARILGQVLSVVLPIAVPHFATTMVVDRTQRCTYAVTSQGLPMSAYWAGTFLSNYVQILFLIVLVPISFLYYQAPVFTEAAQMTKMIAVSICGPVPMILFAYSISRLFSTAEGCTKFFTSFSLFASSAPFLAVTYLTPMGMTPSDLGRLLSSLANYLHVSMCFMNPFYPVPGYFATISFNYYSSIRADLHFPSIFGSVAAVPLVGAVTLSLFLSLTLVYDVDRIRRLFGSCTSSQPNPVDDIEEGVKFTKDPDVVKEEQRVESLSSAEQAVLYKNLVHTYNPGSAREVRAVQGISLSVNRGECFTLLGPNGAGKTTTLDVLTGAIFPPTHGEVSVNGHFVTGDAGEQRAALQGLGNCPQIDPLWPSLTGRQHLLFYGMIKGLPVEVQKQQTAALLEAMGFSDFDADKPTAGYSGGMRRKLALSIALIGSPPTLLLDEPSAAVDAAAKRHLWRVVKQRERGQTVILTTHSMEEAEALSDRLAIQVQGRLRCIGSTDHIKMTHGAGYQLEVIVKKSSAGRKPAPAVLNFISNMCSSSVKMLEYHEGRYLFEIPNLKAIGARRGELSLAALFSTMQSGYDTIALEDYSISRPSLEQVFIRFSKEQKELRMMDPEMHNQPGV